MATATVRKPRVALCELRTMDGETILSASYEKCAAEVVKRCRALFKGQTSVARGDYHRKAVFVGAQPNEFGWVIVGPDGAIRSKHAITVLS